MGFQELILELDDCEGVERLYMSEDFEWELLVKCSNCQYEGEKSIFMSDQKVTGKNNRVECNFYMKCKECGRDQSLNILKREGEYELRVEGRGKAKGVVVKVEGRGCQVLSWVLGTGISIQTEAATFHHVDLTDTWCDYDEQANQNVMIGSIKQIWAPTSK